jgi:hypothetical protein
MKPFDIEKARSGHPVCTRDGRDVEILKFDLKSRHPIVGIIDNRFVNTWPESGTNEGTSNFDLFLKSEQKEGWVNVYESIDYKLGRIHKTKEEAIENIDSGDYIDTAKIKWKE